ncbi:DNA primase/helicase, phage-associated [Methanosarcina mazei SarPi]|uniref:DNA primase/helicase, phage-associated n=2 Tax=Methanosarcina mazei TaxID=2209 RepID=A0A0E3R800_METMZ|nr:DNA primase/helicase, phage-associated [Methanosarcina mazei SarPi]
MWVLIMEKEINELCDIYNNVSKKLNNVEIPEDKNKHVIQAMSFVKSCILPSPMEAADAVAFIENDVRNKYNFEKADIKNLKKYYYTLAKEKNAKLKAETREKEITAKRVEQAEIESTSQTETIKKGVPLSFSSADDAGFAVRVLTKEFLEKFHHVISMGCRLYIYDEGVYKSDELLMSKARVFIQELAWQVHGVAISTQNADRVLKSVYDRVAVHGCDVDNTPNRIVVKNGILDVETGILYPHTPAELHTIKIDINYDPNAKVTADFEKYQETTFKGVEKEIPIVQEMLGYCLYKKYFLEKFFFLIGDGKNGKSVLMNIMTRLLGDKNTTSMTLHDICHPRDQFVLIGLRGKLANVCGETGNELIKNMGNLKKATGRDKIRARDLRQSAVEFYSFAKLIFSMNKPPEIEDSTTGSKRRFMLIDFPNKFGKELTDDFEADKQLEEKLMSEESMTGILTWAVEGLKRIIQNGDFTDTRTEAEMAIIYDKKSNPIRYFVQENINANYNGKIYDAEMFEAYATFAKENKLPSLKNTQIVKMVIAECAEIGIDVKHPQENTAGRRRYFTSVSFVKPEPKPEPEFKFKHPIIVDSKTLSSF